MASTVTMGIIRPRDCALLATPFTGLVTLLQPVMAPILPRRFGNMMLTFGMILVVILAGVVLLWPRKHGRSLRVVGSQLCLSQLGMFIFFVSDLIYIILPSLSSFVVSMVVLFFFPLLRVFGSAVFLLVSLECSIRIHSEENTSHLRPIDLILVPILSSGSCVYLATSIFSVMTLGAHGSTSLLFVLSFVIIASSMWPFIQVMRTYEHVLERLRATTSTTSLTKSIVVPPDALPSSLRRHRTSVLERATMGVLRDDGKAFRNFVILGTGTSILMVRVVAYVNLGVLSLLMYTIESDTSSLPPGLAPKVIGVYVTSALATTLVSAVLFGWAVHRWAGINILTFVDIILNSSPRM